MSEPKTVTYRTMTCYQPGPWEDRGAITCKDGVTIADVHAGNGATDERKHISSDTQKAANKALIKAAPLLYETLEKINSWAFDNNVVIKDADTMKHMKHALQIVSDF